MRKQKSIRVKTAKGRKISSVNWLSRQLNDTYSQLAKQEGYRSRAAYKLLEIDKKFSLLNKTSTVIDLGSSPGGWSQIAIKKCKKVIAIDIIPMVKIEGVIFVQEDFTKINADNFVGEKIDVVLSDMSPAVCGHRQADHIRVMSLSTEVLELAKIVLRSGGRAITKIFHGGQEKELYLEFKKYFEVVKYFKPAASRKGSTEIYLVAINFLE